MTTEQRDKTGAPVRPDAAQDGPADRTFGFIGLGLIGGSIARGLKRADPSVRILAYMRTRSRLEQAKQDGIVDEILDGVNERLRQCDIIFLCTPVEYNAGYLRQIRPFLKPGAVVTDVGSTKTNIHESVAQLDMEDCFVGGHPMAGSEKTGYEHSPTISLRRPGKRPKATPAGCLASRRPSGPSRLSWITGNTTEAWRPSATFRT